MAIIAGNPQPLTRGLAVGLFLQRSNNLSDLTNAGTARTNLGLGTIATQAANNVTISGGSISGITDLAIADGGTGQSTAQAAINALTAVSGATNEHVLTKDTATGNAVFKAATGGSGSPGGSNTQVQINDGGSFGADSLFVWDKANDRLGIGTSSPSYPLHVSATGYPSAYFTSSDAIANRLGVNHSSNTGIGYYIGDALKWSAAAYLPSGSSNYSFVFFNDQTAVNSFFIDGTKDATIFGQPSIGGDLNVAAKMRVSQPNTAFALPVLLIDQADVDEDFVYFIGTSSAATTDRSLIKPSDFPTPGAIKAWIKIKIFDTRSGGIGETDAWIPAYAAPTA